MDQLARTALVDQVDAELALPRTVTYQDACRRVCEVISARLRAPVELRFVAMSNPSLSGATALHTDGTYTILVAASPFWYHRLQILLHEYAHQILDHQPIPLSTSDGLRQLLPHLPERLGDILATRIGLCQEEERDAEALADELLERLTSRAGGIDAASDMPDHLRRVADALGSSTGRRRS